MSVARYTYAPHSTRGFAPNDTGTAELVVTIPGAAGQASGALAMLTAADVTGIPAAQVIRTWPKDGSRGVEPNYLALVEFDSPDVPWLFSRPEQSGRLEPWITLVVLDVTGIAHDDLPLQQSDAGQRLTVDSDALPDPAGAWLWAHVQFLGDEAVPGDPARSLARLVSPRHLDPDRDWLACVVPLLESARLSGMGDVDGADAIRTSRQYAWKPGGGQTVLPVYHSFRFSTGDRGDFEALVRRLHGMPLPDGMGRRRLRIDHPLSGLPAPVPDDPARAGEDIIMHVALRPPTEVDEPIRPLVGASYVSSLLSRLSDAGYDLSLVAGPAAQTPRVGPPVYGQLAAGASGSAADVGKGTSPPWLAELNIDPRLRVAAGMGAEVVRRDQEHYVESAWRQVGDVLAANRLRRRAEFSLGSSLRLYTKWVAQLDAAALLTSAAPVLAKIAVSPTETVRGALAASPVTAAAVSVELRRQSRTRGAFAQPAWGGAVSVAALGARAAAAQPFTTAVGIDGIEVAAAPSGIWQGQRLNDLLHTLVPGLDAASLTSAEAGSKLDAIGGTQGFALPDPAAVTAALAAPSLNVDALVSSFGLLPESAVREAMTNPAPPTTPGTSSVPSAPPTTGTGHATLPSLPHAGLPHAGSPHAPLPHAGLQDADSQHAGVPHTEAQHPAHTPVLPSPGAPAGPAVISAGIPLLSKAHGLADADAIDVLRVNGSLVRTKGARVTIDVAALQSLAGTGLAATTLDVDSFDKIVAGTFVSVPAPAESLGLSAAGAVKARSELVDSLQDLTGRFVHPLPAGAGPQPLVGGLDALHDRVLNALDPRVTLRAAVNSRIAALPDTLEGSFADIMPAPDLSEPTYDDLAAISHDWLLPGLDQLPPDTTTLAASNRTFISAFLVGVNHELARELLWREYPTDQRGTYARQFWSHRLTPDPAARYDLRHELHRSATLSLAALQSDSADPGDDPLVLVIKGELIRRYPSVIVQAGHAVLNHGVRHMGDPPIEPDFRGLLEPDVLLAGFTGLTLPVVLAAKDNPDAAYWFFFSEHVSEPRFGLDDPDGAAWAGSTWNDADWGEAALDRDTFLTGSSFTKSLPKGLGGGPGFAWGADAATQAWITLQFPFRRGIPAADLLAPQEDE